MKKLFLATTTAVLLIAAATPSFAQQSEEGMNAREARRAARFAMEAHMKMIAPGRTVSQWVKQIVSQ